MISADDPSSGAISASPFALPEQGGETGRLIRNRDWASTPLGAIDTWPPSLRTMLSFILASPVALVMLWGEDGIMLYNDAYATFAGGRHPGILGAKVREAWPEAADFNDHVMRTGLSGGTLSYRDQELVLYRHGQPETVWMNLDYAPVLGEDGRPAGVMAVVVDTTDRILALRALRESEERARADAQRVQLALGAGAIIGTWFWDIQNDRFTVDEAFAASFGIDPALGREGLSLEQVVATVHPDDSPGLIAAIDAAVATGGSYSHEYRVRRADGNYYWIEANGRVDRDAEGKPSWFPGVLLDVEARRRVGEERDRAVRLLESFIEAVPGVVYAKDRDGRMLLANRGTAELVGRPVAEIVGKTDAEFLEDKAQAATVMANDRRIMEGGVVEQIEEAVSFADGRRAFWLSTKAPLHDENGDVIGLIGSSIDITARKEVEAKLAESEERFRFALDAAGGIGTWDWDVPGDRIYASRRFAQMYGLDPEEAGAGMPLERYVAGIHPDDHARVEQLIGEAVETGGEFRAEYRLLGRGGEIRWVIARGSCIRDAAGNPVRFPGVTFDITDRKRAENELHALNASLEARIAQALAEREEAHEALRQAQKMEAVGQLTGGIAHDFNNLLTVVTGNIDMTVRSLDAAGIEDARAKRALDAAMKGAERATSLTQRLLAFSRRQPLAPKPLDADRLVAGMSDLLNRALGETIKLEIVTSPGLWRMEADPNQLENAILNLAVNARDAMPLGGTLTIESTNARIDEGYAAQNAEVAPGQYVMIAVTDTGEGMSRETLARVFEPFFTTKEVGKGTGLGLSQVYGFTKQSGGHVKVYSELGQGTTVRLYLPRLLSDDMSETDAPSVTPGLEKSPRRETILAVEDDDDVRAYSVECLRELGYRVLEAHDGASALRLVERQSEPIDLLFTDVVMPNMSGAELAEALRERRPDLRVLFTSGYTRDAIVHGGRLDEGVELIAKPFTFQALASKVRDVLEAGRMRRILVVQPEATMRAFVAEALAGLRYAVDEAATAGEALMKVRAAQGRYDAVVLDADLPDKSGMGLAAELRALHADLPLLIAGEDRAAIEQGALDRAGALPKPYSAAKLTQALRALGLTSS